MAHSRDPAQLAAVAAAVLLVYGLVRLLDHVAARQQAQAAARRQLQLAAKCMTEHAVIADHVASSAAGRASVVTQQPMIQAGHIPQASRTEPSRPLGRRI